MQPSSMSSVISNTALVLSQSHYGGYTIAWSAGVNRVLVLPKPHVGDMQTDLLK